jgi:HlyD family secretion protein
VYAVAAVMTLVLLGGIAMYAGKSFISGDAGASSFKTVPVKQGPFESRVVVRGELQAVDNIDINCQVEGSNTITQLVPEGTFVKKGDVLVVLDSSSIRQKLEDSLIEWQRVKADVTSAEEMLAIQKSQNAANIEAAAVALELAQIDLVRYTEGVYPGLLADAKMAVEKAQTGFRSKQDDLSQTRSLFSKGFVTATEVQNKELEVAAAQRDVTKAVSDMELLEKFSHQADTTAKKSALAQAEQKLERTKRENSANLSQKTADLAAKAQQLDLIERRVARYREQVEFCTIRAPADGLVVYRNDNNRDNVQVAEGTQVRERQTIMRLPDTSRMKAVLKVNEGQIANLSIGQVATVSMSASPAALSGIVTKISPVADSGDRWMNPDRRDYPVDVIFDQTPKGLKPGMTATVNILTDRIEDAIYMPIGALYSAGKDRYAFVVSGENVRPTPVKIGKSNDQDVQIVEGVEAGQNVVLLEAGQGKALLDKAGIKVVEEKPAEGDPTKRRRRDGAAGEGKGPGNGPANNPGNGAGATPGNTPTAEPAKPAEAIPGKPKAAAPTVEAPKAG